MKKIAILLLAALLLVGLCACGNDPAPADTTPQTQPPEGYAFIYKGVKLMPGATFDAAALPDPEYTYTAPNCALDGNDTVYNYVDIEVAVYDDGKSAVIQSVYIINPNLTTPEGLALGDELNKVKEIYGKEYTVEGHQWQFAKGNTIFGVLTQDNFVASMEYRLAG